MNRSRILAAALLLCAMGSAPMAQDAAPTTQTSARAKEFVEKAGSSGLAEVEMGEVGVQKAKNSQVRAFAKEMVADYRKANGELLTAIKGKGLQVPSSRTDMHKGMMQKLLQQEAGKDFDRAYMAQMVEDHKAAVALFEAAADDDGLDINLRGYAKQTLPALREHLQQAQTLQGKLSE